MKICLLFIVFLLSASDLRASGCDEPKTQREINLCAEKKYFDSDQKLNKFYAEVRDRITKNDKLKLKTVQLLWIKYRDTHCGAATEGYQGGSMEPLIKFECLSLMNEQRIEALETAYPEELP